MPKMNQEGTTKGLKGESGESFPSGSATADTSGERREGINAGVGMGMHDRLTGRDSSHAGKAESGEFNSGRSSGVSYKHQKAGYR